MKKQALSIFEDGAKNVCLTCALDHAIKSGMPNLYFSFNELKRVDFDIICDCGKAFGSVENFDASEKILEYVLSK